jgi:hypothetical protein
VAKRIAAVMAKHKVELLKELVGIVAEGGPKERGEKEWRELAKMLQVVVSMARVWTVKEHGQPAGMGREIYEGLAKDGPGPGMRLVAASFLARAAMSESSELDDMPPIYEKVPAATAEKALAGAMEAMLDVSSGKLQLDAAGLMGQAAIIWSKSFYLEMLNEKGTEKEIKEAIEAKVAHVEKLIAAAEKVEHSKEAAEGLAFLKNAADHVKSQSDDMAEAIVNRRGMEATLRAFIKAMNEEDKKEAAKWVTATTWKEMENVDSLKDAWGKGKDVKEIRLGGIQSVGRAREQIDIKCEIIVVDAEGKATTGKRRVRFQKVEGKWLMGSKE